MNRIVKGDLETLWEKQDRELRDPMEIIAYWQDAGRIDPRLLECKVSGRWWETLGESGITLLVTREYEHLLLGLCVDDSSRPLITAMRMPHPSGLAVDRRRGLIHVASTRNPNQIFDLAPVRGTMARLDIQEERLEENILVPVRTRFLPGCLYLHDLAIVGDKLHGNSVGQNAVVVLPDAGGFERVWWPKCIETNAAPVFGRNHLQLNSIAAADDLQGSFFSASTDEMTELRPGDPAFPVDRRGVVFSGQTREPIARGLTRPHSARFHATRVWVDNSGYGEVGFIDDGKFRSVARLGGWTRGLCFFGTLMFVGTSRVLPRFEGYAPGLDVNEASCGVHVLDMMSGEILGSIEWPSGSQIFSVDWVPSSFSTGLPFRTDNRGTEARDKFLFYAFDFPRV